MCELHRGSSTGAVGVVVQRASAAVVDDAITSVARGGASKELSSRQGADGSEGSEHQVAQQNRVVHDAEVEDVVDIAEGIEGLALCANDNETKYPVKFRLRAT